MIKLLFVLFMTLPCQVMANNDAFTLLNNNKALVITRSDLEKLSTHDIRTSTNFTPVSDFSGVLISDFIKKYNIDKDSKLRIFALDDYSYTVPVPELVKYHALLAYKKDKKYIDISAFGPFATVFPRDDFPELKNMDIDAKTIWMIKTIEVQK